MESGGSEREVGLGMGAVEVRRKKWKKWLDSEFYGDIVRVKINGLRAREQVDLGRNEWRMLVNRAGRFWKVEGREAKLFWKEVDGQLAVCVLEAEVEKVLRDLNDGHGHFAAGLTAGRAEG